MNEGAPSDDESQAAAGVGPAASIAQAERETGRSDADGQAVARIERQLREIKMILVILAVGLVVVSVPLFVVPAVLGLLVWTWWREWPEWRAWLGRRRRTR